MNDYDNKSMDKSITYNFSKQSNDTRNALVTSTRKTHILKLPPRDNMIHHRDFTDTSETTTNIKRARPVFLVLAKINNDGILALSTAKVVDDTSTSLTGFDRDSILIY